MSLNDPLANILSKILNAEKVGKRECVASPSSRLILDVLGIMKKKEYIGIFNSLDDGKGGVIKIQLLGHINKCGVIKPRSSFTLRNIEKFEKRFLPAEGFGTIIVSTSKGIIPHEEAINKKIGGKLLAYIY
ncbi:MAG: 30S ribosomal protein S8 [Nanoarchaeota archaeon]|nr:30S ribosomal protein S8 [Nanoarchaeota archaeon]